MQARLRALKGAFCLRALFLRQELKEEGEEEEEEFITSGNWRGKHNSLSRGAGADQP